VVVVSGRSTRHLKAMTNHIHQQVLISSWQQKTLLELLEYKTLPEVDWQCDWIYGFIVILNLCIITLSYELCTVFLGVNTPCMSAIYSINFTHIYIIFSPRKIFLKSM
jgi:hypothetical protein